MSYSDLDRTAEILSMTAEEQLELAAVWCVSAKMLTNWPLPESPKEVVESWHRWNAAKVIWGEPFREVHDLWKEAKAAALHPLNVL